MAEIIEEIIELYPDTIPTQSYNEIIKQENVLSSPIIINSTIRGTTIDTGSGNSCLKFDNGYGLWLGNASFSSAPFSVNMAGVLTCAGATIRGTLNADDITAGTLSLNRIANDSITSVKVKMSLRGSSHNLVFLVTDADTVAWASGAITFSDGASYSIDAGNTGNMAARTYIYLDIGVSITVLQISTTFSDAVGENKILIASAQNGAVEATFYVMGGIGGINVDASNIIATNLAVISADMGSITAGNITIDSTGFIRGGQTAYRTGNGWWEGYDTSTYKFSIKGTSGDEFYFDGVNVGMTSTKFLVGEMTWVATDDLRNSNDTEKSTTSYSYVKLKECKLNTVLPVCRIKFDLMRTTGGTGYAQIYKNGVAIGTEWSSTSSTYSTKSQDFTDFAFGDLIQIYAYNSEGYSAYVRNFRFYYYRSITKFSSLVLDTPLTFTPIAISVTNQDP